MGKKGSWFSAIKRVFIPNSKDKPANGTEKKNSKEKEKKKGRGILRHHGEPKSFIPLFREPSSIEKILGEADEQKLFIQPPTRVDQQPKTPPLLLPPRAPSLKVASPRVGSPRAASPRFPSPKALSPKATASSSRISISPRQFGCRPEPTLRHHHLSATKIQAAYRGYSARRSFRALRGLVRLQGVVRGQNVKRQTMKAMKMMQLLVRVQTQIQSRRIQMLENQALQRQAQKIDKEFETTFSKWTVQSEAGQNEGWDDSLLPKEEREERLQRKVEAIIKRERAMAYAYSHQLWKVTPKSAQAGLVDVRSGGFPWWWNWLERQLSPVNPPERPSTKNFPMMTPPRPKPSPTPASSKYNKQYNNVGFDNLESATPRSTKSVFPMRSKPMHTPTRTPPANGLGLMMRPRASVADSTSAFDLPLKDDDSLTSCPPFLFPNYMTPTISAKAKARASSNPKERFPVTPSDDLKERFPVTPSNYLKKRFSFPLTPNFSPFKWNKESSKDSSSQKVLDKHQPLQLHAEGDLSIDSSISMPAVVGRKPFNRFV